jgi:hypothetical protein
MEREVDFFSIGNVSISSTVDVISSEPWLMYSQQGKAGFGTNHGILHRYTNIFEHSKAAGLTKLCKSPKEIPPPSP